MSVNIKYKGGTIAEITESVTKTLKTSGKYCEADIVVENTKDGGITPSGGSLPSVISKIDGGSFTLASNTDVGNYSISHNLGEKPKGFVIWSDDVVYGTDETDLMLVNLMLKVCDYSATAVAAYMATRKPTSGTFGQYTNTVAAAAESSWLSPSYIKIGMSAASYKSGATYNWIAWA